jgi:hypothetical protein
VTPPATLLRARHAAAGGAQFHRRVAAGQPGRRPPCRSEALRQTFPAPPPRTGHAAAPQRPKAPRSPPNSRPQRERCRVARTQVKYQDSRPVSALRSTGRLVLIQFVSVGGMRTGPVPDRVPCCFRALRAPSQRRFSAHLPASSRAAPAQGSVSCIPCSISL